VRPDDDETSARIETAMQGGGEATTGSRPPRVTLEALCLWCEYVDGHVQPKTSASLDVVTIRCVVSDKLILLEAQVLEPKATKNESLGRMWLW
jgi:hypothetical protein